MTRLLVTDFDDTFYNGNDAVKNKEYTEKWMNMGNYFVIATGRHSQKLIKHIKEDNIIFDYIICNDGGIILDHNLNVIYQRDIPEDLIEPVVNMVQNNKYITSYYIDKGLEITNNIDGNANGIICKTNNYEEAKKLLNEITKKYPKVHGYVDNLYNFLCITEKSVSKGSGVEIINSILKIDKKNIYTIGDNINDISMSIYNSYCMKNSYEELNNICNGTYDSLYKFIKDIMEGVK